MSNIDKVAKFDSSIPSGEVAKKLKLTKQQVYAARNALKKRESKLKLKPKPNMEIHLVPSSGSLRAAVAEAERAIKKLKELIG